MVIGHTRRKHCFRMKLLDLILLLFLVTIASIFFMFVFNHERKDNVEGHLGSSTTSSVQSHDSFQVANHKSRAKIKKSILSTDMIIRYGHGWTDETDPQFLEYIRQRWLVAPSSGPVNITDIVPDTDYSQFGQSRFVDKILKQMRNGFFIECGAADGKMYSNTLFLELERKWTGLLIEPNPTYFQSIISTKRNAYTINSCLSTNKSTQKVIFKPLGLFGGVDGTMDETHLRFLKKLAHYSTRDITAHCFTLSSILLALDQNIINYFSLDVEGPELEILQTIPFDKIRIEIISVEYRLSDNIQINELGSMDKLNRIRDFFSNLGTYVEIGILPWGSAANRDMQEEKGLDVLFQRIH